MAYAFVEAGQSALALLVVPASLFWLTPADMGAVTLAQLGSLLTLTIGACGLDFAIIRSYLKWPEDARGAHVRWILHAVTLWSIVLVAAAGAAWALRPDASWAAITFFSVAAGAGLAIRSVPMSIFRVTSRFRPYATVAVGGSAVQAALQLALLVGGAGLNGYLGAIAIACCGSAVLAWRLSPHGRTQAPGLAPEPATVRIAAANVVSSLIDRLVSNADRFALSAWASIGALGVYGTAARMSMPLRIVTGATSMALAPAFSREEHGGRMADVSGVIVAPFVTLLGLVGSLLQLFSWSLWLTPWRTVLGDFQPLLSLLVLSQLVASVVVVGQLLLYYLDRPVQAGGLAVLNAIIMVGGLVWLVPSYGAPGAAIVQLLASISALVAVAATTHTLRWIAPRVLHVLAVSGAVTAAVWTAPPMAGAAATLAGSALLARWAWHDLDHGRLLRQLFTLAPSRRG
jgi:O-antigen/teichoic acid export membrane protein